MEDFGGTYRKHCSSELSISKSLRLLNSFTESGDMFSKISKEETDDGTLIVEDFLRTWKTRVEAARAAGEGDVPMVPKEEEQMEMLKSVVAEYKEKFDGNAWVKAVLENL